VLECVPNVSEGRDARVIDALAAAVTGAGAQLLDVHRDPDHHRSVFTFIGESEVIARAAQELGRVAVARIDMRRHHGVHPRIGALDVLPLVPLAGSEMRDAVEMAHRVGRALAADLGLPVLFYGDAAVVPGRRELPAIRAGGFETLAQRLAEPDWRPDAGPTRPHPTAGASVVGARRVLIAFNAVLHTTDNTVARAVARAIRESSGGLPAVRAIGVPLPSRGVVQVAINLIDYHRTPVRAVTERLEREVERANVAVVEYELVGCAPADAFAEPLTRPIAGLSPSRLLEPALFRTS
jgi:glutamate formiminotransferase